jgi:hypothetical protein
MGTKKKPHFYTFDIMKCNDEIPAIYSVHNNIILFALQGAKIQINKRQRKFMSDFFRAGNKKIR